MGPMFIVIALLGVLVGIITLIKPIRFIGVPTRKRAAMVLGAAVLAFMIGGALLPGSCSSPGVAPTVAAPAAVASVPPVPTPTVPADQAGFVKAIEAGRDAFRGAANEMAQG